MGIDMSSDSTRIEASSKDGSTESFILSNNNFNFGLKYTWRLSPSFHLVGNYLPKKYDFLDSEGIINNNETIKVNKIELGVKLVVFSWAAISLMNINDKDISHQVVNNLIEIQSSSINYMRFIYHQLIFSSGGFLIAADIHYDLDAMTDFIDTRSAQGGRGYIKLHGNAWSMDIYYGLLRVTKESTGIDFTQKDSYAGLTFSMFM